MTIIMMTKSVGTNDNFKVAIQQRGEKDTYAYQCESLLSVMSFDRGSGIKSAEVVLGVCCDECAARSILLLMEEIRKERPKAYARYVQLLHEITRA
jgi:hypothetical protein